MIVSQQNKSWKIVEGLKIDDFSREKMDLTAKELKEECETASEFLSIAWLESNPQMHLTNENLKSSL